MYRCTNGVHLEVELENHLKCFGRNQCYPVGTGKGIWWYWATSGSGTGKSVSITMVATVETERAAIVREMASYNYWRAQKMLLISFVKINSKYWRELCLVYQR